MSRDIRSFFTTVPKKTASTTSTSVTTDVSKKSVHVVSSDDDVIPDTPPVKNVKKLTKKRRVLDDSDSDENKKKNKKIKLPSDKTKIDRKPVSVADILGSSPVKRSEVKIKKVLLKPACKTEIEIHSDEEFEKTLLQLDEKSFMSNIENEANSNLVAKDGVSIGTSYKNGSEITKLQIPESEVKSVSISSAISEERTQSSKILNQANRTPDSRKRKIGIDELNESGIDPDEERHEKRRHSAILYQKYLHRGGPKNPGSKVIPKGKPKCLHGLTFVISGVLESLERDEAASIITDLGGKVAHSLSKKTTYLLVGDDAGPAKVAKAEQMKIKLLSEDELLDLIRTKSGLLPAKDSEVSPNDLKTKNYEVKEKERTNKKTVETDNVKPEIKINKNENDTEIKQKMTNKELMDQENGFSKDQVKEKERTNKKTVKTDNVKPETKINKNENDTEIKQKMTNKELMNQESGFSKDSKTDNINHLEIKHIKEDKKSVNKLNDVKNVVVLKKENEPTVSLNNPRIEDDHYKNINSVDNLAWVDKYKPTSTKQIIGQQGAASNCSKLIKWLSNWYTNHDSKTKLTKPSPWAKSDDGAYFKAALLSGPPGVGKTTTATLVCQELGFDTVEFNASDTRSKKLLKEQVSDLLSNKSLHGYFVDVNESVTKKHVLIMDEVDGMAGNEDRGGIQELIALIKDSSVPIICMCNDRNHQKMRTLVNYCFDLRFSKPRLEQIKGAMMTVCFKENINIKPDALSEIISGANQDIRQTLNHLSMWSADTKMISLDTASKESNSAKKDIKLGPWEVVRKVFSAEEHKHMALQDKSDLFFFDYSLGPLFVQQNYLIVTPKLPKKEHMNRVALTADSLSIGDLIDRRIRSNSAWSMLPMQAMFSSVLPGEYMAGHVSGQINFPGWLGKNSKRNKLLRMASEVHSHIRTRTSASKLSVHTDYCQPLLGAITRPLITEGLAGVSTCIEVLKEYRLLREDIENLQELSVWPGKKDPMAAVDGKVKASLTRTYNKQVAPYSYSAASVSKKKAAVEPETGLGEEDVEEQEAADSEEDKEDDNIENDAMIKAKKKPAAQATKKASGSRTTSKVSTRGTGRGRGK